MRQLLRDFISHRVALEEAQCSLELSAEHLELVSKAILEPGRQLEEARA